MVGEQLVTDLAEKRPQLPVLICTGQPNRVHFPEGDKLGQIPVLAKPFTPGELAEAVHRCLSREGAGKNNSQSVGVP